MKILLTGGSGFLGLEIAKQLTEAGHEVVSLQRTWSKELDNLKVVQILADLSNATKLENILNTTFDAVIHTAAKAGIWGSYKSYYKANFLATKNLVDWAIAKNIKYFIYTSTPSVVYEKSPLENVDESKPYSEKFLTYYAETKAQAERYVLSAQKENFQVVALRPHLIWGKNDPHLMPRLLARAKKNKLIQVGSGHNLVDVIHVTNAAHAHLCALNFLVDDITNGGKAYFIGQERPVPLWWFIGKLLETQGLKKTGQTVSLNVAYAAGAVLEFFYRLLPFLGEPPMTRFLALQLGTTHYFNQSAAINDLAYRPKLSIEDGLRTI